MYCRCRGRVRPRYLQVNQQTTVRPNDWVLWPAGCAICAASRPKTLREDRPPSSVPPTESWPSPSFPRRVHRMTSGWGPTCGDAFAEKVHRRPPMRRQLRLISTPSSTRAQSCCVFASYPQTCNRNRCLWLHLHRKNHHSKSKIKRIYLRDQRSKRSSGKLGTHFGANPFVSSENKGSLATQKYRIAKLIPLVWPKQVMMAIAEEIKHNFFFQPKSLLKTIR